MLLYKHAALMGINRDCWTRSQNNESAWGDMSSCELYDFSNYDASLSVSVLYKAGLIIHITISCSRYEYAFNFPVDF